jgi:broad specificity phosphatase PhoE
VELRRRRAILRIGQSTECRGSGAPPTKLKVKIAMKSLVLIPWAETEWSAAGRVAGGTPLPLTENGRSVARHWAESMAAAGPGTLYSSEEQTSVDVARVIASRTGGTCKIVPDLAEVDVGLWDGLTVEELKRRYPKTFKKWNADPSSVCPPEGEELEHARGRIFRAFEAILRKGDGQCIGVVLGPLAFALARCWLETAEVCDLHAMVHTEPLRFESAGDDAWVPIGPLVDVVHEASSGMTVDVGHDTKRN